GLCDGHRPRQRAKPAGGCRTPAQRDWRGCRLDIAIRQFCCGNGRSRRERPRHVVARPYAPTDGCQHCRRRRARAYSGRRERGCLSCPATSLLPVPDRGVADRLAVAAGALLMRGPCLPVCRNLDRDFHVFLAVMGRLDKIVRAFVDQTEGIEFGDGVTDILVTLAVELAAA